METRWVVLLSAVLLTGACGEPGAISYTSIAEVADPPEGAEDLPETQEGENGENSQDEQEHLNPTSPDASPATPPDTSPETPPETSSHNIPSLPPDWGRGKWTVRDPQLLCAPANGACKWTLTSEDGSVQYQITDTRCDGQMDSRSTCRFLYKDPEQTRHDYNCDGVPEGRRAEDHYDPQRRTREVFSGTPTNGGSSTCTRYIYNEEGQVLWRAIDVDCNGYGNHCLSRVYDDEGRLVDEKAVGPCESDYCDGWHWDFSDDGRQVVSCRYADNCQSTNQESCTRDEFDEQGRRILVGEPVIDDPSAACLHIRYEGEARWEGKDEGCDGQMDSCEVHYQRMEMDNGHHREAKYLDLDCDGAADRLCSFTEYNLRGDVVAYRLQLDDDCEVVRRSCNLYEFDEQGRRVARFDDDDCDPNTPATPCVFHAYDMAPPLGAPETIVWSD